MITRIFFLVTFCLIAFAVNGQTTNGLVAYYLFYEAPDAVVSDSSSNNNNGLIIGTDWQCSVDRFGSSNSSLFMNLTDPPNTNSGTYVSVPRSTNLDFNQDFTLTVWVNITNGLPPYHVHNLIANGSDASSANLRLISNANTNGMDYFQFVGNTYPGPTGVDVHFFINPVRNQWWQAVAVRSGTNISLYSNGVLLTNAPVNTTLQNLPEIWLGSMPLTTNETASIGEYPLDGGIDDVRMYDRALSVSEIQQLYAAESTPMIGLVEAVKPIFSNLQVGSNYQLQVSTDLNTWVNQGASFTATNTSMSYTEYFDTTNSLKLFFRLLSAP